MKINESVHPEYEAMLSFWEKYRATYIGGKDFVNDYLIKFSVRETTTEFDERKVITYCPAFAKAAVVDVKNSIFQRINDVKRSNGSASWLIATTGEGYGVDLKGNTMNGYIGRIILPELLPIGKVGVYVDKPIVEGSTLLETKDVRPYLYTYKAEDIRNWAYNNYNQLTSLLLRNVVNAIDPETGLVMDEIEEYLLFRLIDVGVLVTKYNDEGIPINEIILSIPEIPFEIFELSNSLLIDTADYQIAYLNMASSDVNYALKANFPFYTEQYNAITEMGGQLRSALGTDTTTQGTGDKAKVAENKEITVGTTQGRRYPKGTDRPGFINPSSEPLKVSMEKQLQLKEEIRQLTNLAVSNIEPRRESADSKAQDEKSLEAGLSYIGLELEYGERRIATLWGNYERVKDEPIIRYPRTYSLKTDSERNTEAKELESRRDSIPSSIYKKEISKQIVEITLGPKVSDAIIKDINKEIDLAVVINTDHKTVREDHEAGLVGTETASKTLGYPEGEVEKAKEDHAERAARIANAQSKHNNLINPDARGVSDLAITNEEK